MKIYYGHKRGLTGGTLDVDMNAGSGKTRDAVENIIWTDQSKLRAGRYEVRVHNFCKKRTYRLWIRGRKSKSMENFISSTMIRWCQTENILR